MPGPVDEPALIRLRDGVGMAAVLMDDRAERDAAMHRILAGLSPGTRVVRVGNPLRAPLTLDRILIQLAGPEADLPGGEDARTVIAAVLQQGGAAPVLLSIEQAETLHPAGLLDLWAAAQPFTQRSVDGAGPALQLLFIGGPAFASILAHEGMETLREALDVRPASEPPPPPMLAPIPHVVPPPPPVQTVPPAPMEAPVTPGTLATPVPDVMVARYARSVETSIETKRRLRRRLLGAAVAIALIGVALGAGMRLFYRDMLPQPGLPQAESATPVPPSGPLPETAFSPSLLPIPIPPAPPNTIPPPPALSPPVSPPPASMPTASSPTVSAPAVPRPAAVPTPADTARLRREFDAFIRMQGSNAATLTEPQRAALFNDFLDWRARGGTTPAR